MKKCLVYALIDPTTDHIRYIGKSTSGLARPKAHAYPSKNAIDQTHRGHWIRSLLAQGLIYRIEVLEECDSPDAVAKAECAWIARKRAEGCPLTNATDGGEGCVGRRLSDETRRKIGLANAARLNTPEARAKGAATRRGVPLDPERSKKLHEGNKGRKRTPEHCQRQSERQKDQRLPDAAYVATVERSKGKPIPADVRAKMSASLRGRVFTPEHRAKLAAAGMGHGMSEETKAKINATKRARAEECTRRTGASSDSTRD